MFRRRKWTKWGVALMLGVFPITLLTACLGAGNTENTGSAGSADSGTVNWWGWTPTPALAKGYIEEFNKEYPDITVKYRFFENDAYVAAMRPAVAGGEGPDLFGISGGRPNSNVATYGHAAIDLQPAIEKELGPDWKSKVAPSGVEAFTTEEGKLAGLSLGYVAAGNMWINQEMFDKYDLDPPTDLKSWKKVCKTLRENKKGCLTTGAGQGIFNLDVLHSISDTIDPSFFNDAARGKASWSDPTFVEALRTFKQLQTDEIMDPGALGLQQYPDANNRFLSERSGMIQMGTWYRQYTTARGATAGMEGAGVADPQPFAMVPIPFPDVAGEGNYGNLYTDPDVGLAVSTNSDVQAAATTFATWLAASKAGQHQVANALDYNPALVSAEPSWDEIKLVDSKVQEPALQDLVTKTRAAEQPRNRLLSVEVGTAIEDESIAVMDGTKTPKEAAANVQAAAEDK